MSVRRAIKQSGDACSWQRCISSIVLRICAFLAVLGASLADGRGKIAIHVDKISRDDRVADVEGAAGDHFDAAYV